MYLSLTDTLETSVKLGSDVSITLDLQVPTNTELCGTNTLIANLQDGSDLPDFFTFTDTDGYLSAITEDN